MFLKAWKLVIGALMNSASKAVCVSLTAEQSGFPVELQNILMINDCQTLVDQQPGHVQHSKVVHM